MPCQGLQVDVPLSEGGARVAWFEAKAPLLPGSALSVTASWRGSL